MITGIIAIVIIVGAGIPAVTEGQWGVFAVCAVVAVFLLALGAVSRMDDRAHVNRMHYWSMSGKDRARARHQWEAEARREEEAERERLRQRRLKREAREARKPVVSPTAQKGGGTRCARCGRTAKEVSRPVCGSARFVLYECQKCGERKLVKIE